MLYLSNPANSATTSAVFSVTVCWHFRWHSLTIPGRFAVAFTLDCLAADFSGRPPSVYNTPRDMRDEAMALSLEIIPKFSMHFVNDI
jgi:hypothetical protein